MSHNDFKKSIFCHFAFFRFTDRYWVLSSDEKEAFQAKWAAALGEVSTIKLYQVYPIDPAADVMVWSTFEAPAPDAAATFFERWATATTPFRALAETTTILWGFTARSQYSKARSKQELDPMSDDRRRYLIVYPFVKTSEWYLLGRDSRQGMMNEHIRIGKQFTEIAQLLLYSFGLQDQEFVVVYETDDLVLFSDLVRELRGTEGRRYTERDAPLHTAVHHPGDGALALFR